MGKIFEAGYQGSGTTRAKMPRRLTKGLHSGETITS
jgi:hypothetical protein